MEDFRIIYRILKFDKQRFKTILVCTKTLSCKTLAVKLLKIHALLQELQDSGHIKGLHIVQYIRQPEHIQQPLRPKITLKGLEYLNENSLMKQAAAFAKGIKEIVPGI